jgi:tetratricopeptide (TPR) repeat protein
MKINVIRLIFLLLIATTVDSQLTAQDAVIDSLKLEIKNAQHDSVKIKSSISLGEMIYQSEAGKAINLWKYSAKLCETNLLDERLDNERSKNFYLKYQAGALNNIGFIADYHGDTKKALFYYQKSIRILQELGDKDGIGTLSNNIGFIYKNQGDIPKALEFYHFSLKIREEIKDTIAIANSLNNIGFIYDNQGDIEKAFEYYRRSLRYQKAIGDQKGIANSLNNIGGIYKKKNDISKSLFYYLKSLKIRKKIADKKGIAISLNNIGGIYLLKKKYAQATTYFQESLIIREEISDKVGVTSSLTSLATSLFQRGNTNDALAYALRSLKTAKELGFPEHLKAVASILKEIYKKQNKSKDALEMFELEVQMRDSVTNSENNKAAISKQFQYDYEKKITADSVMNLQESKVRNARLTAQHAQLKHAKTFRIALIVGLILVLIFAGFVFNRFKISQRQQIVIEKQNSEVIEQQKEIIDSITYAKRLQKAILPHRKEILAIVPESFVIYQPKDIVAGDFYWAENINEYYYLAVADCTGHGVPGAIVSMVCSNALNRTVNEFGHTETGAILNHVRELVLKTFIKSGEDIQDGMDITLTRINKKTKEIQWSGANIPLWYIKNNELTEIKADKQPIGKYDYSKPFTTHNLTAEKGTNYYLFTDGYSDQFSDSDKKMTKKRFRDLLLSVQEKNMAEQKIVIEDYFNQWKGGTEQIDDMCIIGITI